MRKPRLLIAEDEEGVREALRLVLGEIYEVETAIDGNEALSKLKHERFDAVLLDIKMPKLSGLDVMRRLQQEKVAAPPILVLTAYQSVELAKEAVKLGAIDYLPKPFERQHLLDAVRDAVKDSHTKKADASGEKDHR